jgi:DNA-binding CsgD family transcriptional regulator
LIGGIMSRRLAEAAGAIQRARSVQQLKDTYIDQARSLFGARSIGISFLDQVDPLRPSVDREVVGIPDDISETYENLGRRSDPLVQFVLHKFAPVHQRELFSDDEWLNLEPTREARQRCGLHHYLSAPLLRAGAVVATLQVARTCTERAFDRHDLRTASALSTLLSERLAALELGRCIAAEGLTVREQQVVSIVVEGFTNDVVARRLGISTNTVKFVLKNVFRKLGVSSRTQLASRSARQL